MKDKLMKMLERRKDEMIQIRRYLHEHPELSFQEENTSHYIEEFYKGKDVGIETHVGGGYGIIVTITGESLEKQLGYGLISMPFQFSRKPMYLLNPKI